MTTDRFYSDRLHVASLLLLLIIGLQVTLCTRAHLSVQFISYNNAIDIINDGSECDGVFAGTCDPFFTFTLYEGSTQRRKSIRSRVWQDRPSILFGSKLGNGVPNPVIINLPHWNTTGYQLILKAHDEDVQYNDIIADWFESIQSLGRRRIRLENRGSIRLVIEVNGYCSRYFYGPDCRTYCQPQATYSCNNLTGEKICNSGNVCNEVDDVCKESSCNWKGECIEESHTFTCQCNFRYTGQFCEIAPTDKNECQGNENCQTAGECYRNVTLTEKLSSSLCQNEFDLGEKCHNLIRTPPSETSDRTCFSLDAFNCSEQRFEASLMVQPHMRKRCIWDFDTISCQERNGTLHPFFNEPKSVFCLQKEDEESSVNKSDMGKRYWYIWLFGGLALAFMIGGGVICGVKVHRNRNTKRVVLMRKIEMAARRPPTVPSRRGEASEYSEIEDTLSSRRTLDNVYAYCGRMQQSVEPAAPAGSYITLVREENCTPTFNGTNNNNDLMNTGLGTYRSTSELVEAPTSPPVYITNPVTGYLFHGDVKAQQDLRKMKSLKTDSKYDELSKNEMSQEVNE